MKIIVIGAGGDIGQAVCDELGGRHELVRVGRTGGDMQVDMADRAAVDAMYASLGTVDAVVSAAGDAHFAPLSEQTSETMMLGLRHKVMGQINLVLGGLDAVSEGGSFTLTSGVLDRDPIPMGWEPRQRMVRLPGSSRVPRSTMPRGLRVNVVSPGLLDVSAPRYGAWFPGHEPVSAARVGRAYAKSVEGALTGRVIIVE